MIVMEGLPLSVQELSRELSAFGVDPIAIEALKGRQLLCLLRSCSYLYFI